MTSTRSGAVVPSRRRRLVALFGFSLLLFAASLPWQRRQWAEVTRRDAETAAQQARISATNQKRASMAEAERRLRQVPGDVAARLTLATALADQQDTARAAREVKTLESAAARSPQFADALAGLYQQIGYHDRALAMARLAHRLAPDAPGTLLRRGYVELALGRPAVAKALFHKAASHAPDAPEPHLALALAFSTDEVGDLKAAERELAAAQRLRPSDWNILVLRAQNQGAQRRHDEALQTLQQALRIAPAEPQVYSQLAQILYDRARSSTEPFTASTMEPIRRAAENCLRLDPQNRAARYLLGAAYLNSGQEPEARREWEHLFAIAPTYPKLRTELGRLLVRQGERERGLALIAEGRREQLDEAEFNRLVIRVGTASENVDLRRTLARWCMEHGRLSRAILEWEEVLACVPGDAEARQGTRAARSLRGDP